MSKCSYCSRNIEPGTGVMFIKNDGKIFRFDSRKCEKGMIKLKRDPRNVKWIKKMKQENNI